MNSQIYVIDVDVMVGSVASEDLISFVGEGGPRGSPVATATTPATTPATLVALTERYPALPVVAEKAGVSTSHVTREKNVDREGWALADGRSIGSSLTLWLLANGEADLYPCTGVPMRWNTADGDAIHRAWSGTTVNLEGFARIYLNDRFWCSDCMEIGGFPTPALRFSYSRDRRPISRGFA